MRGYRGNPGKNAFAFSGSTSDQRFDRLSLRKTRAEGEIESRRREIFEYDCSVNLTPSIGWKSASNAPPQCPFRGQETCNRCPVRRARTWLESIVRRRLHKPAEVQVGSSEWANPRSRGRGRSSGKRWSSRFAVSRSETSKNAILRREKSLRDSMATRHFQQL